MKRRANATTVTLDATDLIRRQLEGAHAWLDEIISDVSEEQASWRPPGVANSIAATYAHAVMSEDIDFSRHVFDRTPLYQGEWAGRTGLSQPYPDVYGGWHDWAVRLRVDDWDATRAYARAVQSRVESTLDGLTELDLDRPVDMSEYGLGIWTVLDVYLLHAGRHIWMHGGEIACLKGMQGDRGYVG